jgi:hypothetical protein
LAEHEKANCSDALLPSQTQKEKYHVMSSLICGSRPKCVMNVTRLSAEEGKQQEVKESVMVE